MVVSCGSPRHSALRMRAERPLAQRIKKYGDNGSPCHNPRPGRIVPATSLLTKTE